jgi:hypothetical protein
VEEQYGDQTREQGSRGEKDRDQQDKAQREDQGEYRELRVIGDSGSVPAIEALHQGSQKRDQYEDECPELEEPLHFAMIRR